MQVSTLVGIVAMVIAVVLYSIGVWGAFRAKRFSQKNVMFVVGGVVFDAIGTGAMFVSAGYAFKNDLHTWVALVAFFAMLLLGIVGTWAVQKNRDELLAKLSRWALAPWALWAVVFVWGFFTNMPRK
jgi:uncharacterized repeat protein (TIGR03987 family)